MTDLYQTQRAMRNMRQAAMQRGVIAILDIGSSKIACLVLRFDGPSQFSDADGIGSLAGQSSFRVIGAATTRSRGVRFGEIDAMQETERAIRTAVQAAQKMANTRVDHVIACFAGARPRSYGLDGMVALDENIATEQDIARVMASCDVPDFGDGREVLHAQPVNFAIDHRSGLGDPRGQMGNELAVDMHLLTVDETVIQNLLYCIKRCDLELAGLASSSYVSGISALVEDEQELGAACIDLGGGATGLSIFMRKHMIYSDAVRLCDEGLLVELDHSMLPAAPDGTPAAEDFIEGALTDCAVANIVWSTVMAYNTENNATSPDSIDDFFNLADFPGKRGLRKNAKANLEMALMADGVPADEVYDMLETDEGVDKAFAKLDTIKDEVVW